MAGIIELENLTKKFIVTKGGFWHRTHTEVTAVNDISLSIPEGQSLAFIGPNGAGKSTTIKMLTGILEPSSGTASVLGVSPWRERHKLARNIGAVFGQRSQLWYHLPPNDTFDLLAKIYNLSSQEYKGRRDLLIKEFDLGPILTTPVRKLSLGQRMRAEIAASLLHNPRVLFLDEPTIGLDVVARQELRHLIHQWNRNDGLTVFLTSHDAGDIESVAERVVIVNHGRIVLDDTVTGMRRDYLGSKILQVTFHEMPAPIALEGVTLLEKTDYSLKLEVDTEKISIQKLISQIIQAATVADLTIEDPPLEEVIAHIYGAQPRVGEEEVNVT